MNTFKYLVGLFIFCFVMLLRGQAQETGAGINYQMTLISNPSVTGSEGDGILRLSYVNYYPGNSFNLHAIRLSYDGYIPELHGGAGFYITGDYLGGIVNELKGGFSYSYFFRAGKDLYISGGLSASVYHRGFDFGRAVLPDQIDPLGGSFMPSGEALASTGRTLFDMNTGILFMTGNIYGGIAIDHLAEPVLTETDIAIDRLKRRILIHIAGDIYPGQGKMLRISPAGKLEAGEGLLLAAAGASFESKYLSVSSVLFYNNYKNLDIQTGFSVSTGNLMFFYNYRFNILSGNSMMPFSILHHTGIAFRLNNVDKRKTIKTINFPKL